MALLLDCMRINKKLFHFDKSIIIIKDRESVELSIPVCKRVADN